MSQLLHLIYIKVCVCVCVGVCVTVIVLVWLPPKADPKKRIQVQIARKGFIRTKL